MMESYSIAGEGLRIITSDKVDVMAAADGSPRYKIQGFTMAWCHSVAEAIRVASILSRSSDAMPDVPESASFCST